MNVLKTVPVRTWIPAIHLPHGRELFKPLPFRPSVFKKTLKSYAERALLNCAQKDTLVLPEMPEESYLEFLLSAGLGTENIIVCNGNEDNFAQDILACEKTMEKLSLKADGITSASFYIHLEEEREMAEKLGVKCKTMHPDLTRMFNTLYFFIRMEEGIGASSFKRASVRSSRFREPALELLQKHGALFVRGNESIGGSQTFIIKTAKDIEETAKVISRNRQITRYFISPYMEACGSWNVQYQLENGFFALLGASRQVLEGSAHKGNRGGVKAPAKVVSSAEKIAERIADMGGAGIMGIDVMICENKAYPVEVNARQNTSTPAISVFNKISGAKKGICFQTFGMNVGRNFDFAGFVKLAGKKNLFDPAKCHGFLPYHFSASRFTGRIDVAVFANDENELGGMTNKLLRVA